MARSQMSPAVTSLALAASLQLPQVWCFFFGGVGLGWKKTGKWSELDSFRGKGVEMRVEMREMEKKHILTWSNCLQF